MTLSLSRSAGVFEVWPGLSLWKQRDNTHYYYWVYIIIIIIIIIIIYIYIYIFFFKKKDKKCLLCERTVEHGIGCVTKHFVMCMGGVDTRLVDRILSKENANRKLRDERRLAAARLEQEQNADDDFVVGDEEGFDSDDIESQDELKYAVRDHFAEEIRSKLAKKRKKLPVSFFFWKINQKKLLTQNKEGQKVKEEWEDNKDEEEKEERGRRQRHFDIGFSFE